MAIGLVVATRNARLQALLDDIDAAATAAQLIGYDGTRPATGGAATNEVFTCTFGDPSFGAPAAGQMTANAITGDADATGGTTTWFRIVDGDGNPVADGSCGTSGADLNFDSTVISAGASVDITSFVLDEGNA